MTQYFVAFIAEPNNKLDEEEAKKLLHEAMEKGYVTSQHVVIILVGIAGSGKSSFKRVVLNLPPDKERVSTGLVEAIRNISISRAIVDGSESVEWQVVTPDKLLDMLADAIKEVGVPEEPTQVLPSTSAASLSTSAIQSDVSNEEMKSRDVQASDSPESSIQNEPGIVSKDESPRAKEEDDEFEFKDDPLLGLIGRSKGSKRLLGVHWVYIMDTGGQPQFLQLLPAFIKNISSCVCFVRLDQSLDKKPLVQFFDKSGTQCGDSYPSEHTNLQLIESCIRTIHSRCCLNSETPPSCFVVGTHLDEYEDKPHLETMKRKNEILLKKFSNLVLEKSLMLYRSGDDNEELIFPMNCKTPEERDCNIAAEFRKCVMSRCHEPVCEVPLAWFVLEERICQYAAKKNVAYVEITTCFKIASQLHMSNKTFQAALDHLVKLNIFRKYSSLPHLIFCDTHVVLLKLTELVQYSFRLRKADVIGISGEDVAFKNEGIITVKFLSADRFSNFYSDLFTPESFLKILLDLLAVANLSDRRSTDERYFLPCLLKELDEKEVCKYRSSSECLSPLLIYLADGCLPNGLFSSFVASLKNSHGWRLAYRGHKPICLYQNCIMFSVPGSGNLPGSVILIASFKYLEVHVNCPFESEIDSICSKVYEDINSGLKASWQVLYPEKELSFELAFFCSSCSGPSVSSESSSSHLSSLEYHHAEICSRKYEKCSLDPQRAIELCDSKLRWLRNLRSE